MTTTLPDNSNSNRATALDAVRGFAILTMVLSGTIRYKILPSWMYHAQLTSPEPGLTWVDLVFPLFLFALGAAIPLAMSRRLEKKDSPLSIVLYILKRGFLLTAFALFLQHLRPHIIHPSDADMEKWWLALKGFVLIFLMFVRLPNFIKNKRYQSDLNLIINLGAWIAAILLISQIQYPNGQGFSFERNDIILILLANSAVFGSLVWWLTRSNLWWRLGFLSVLFGMRLSVTNSESWIGILWHKSFAPWLFQLDYLKYLFIVIPATIAGDAIITWLQAPAVENKIENPREKWQFLGIILLMLALCLTLLVGLQSRMVLKTTVASIILCGLGWRLFVNPASPTANLLKHYYQWGVYWLALGLALEPFQGGIKKDPTTVSFCFITVSISFFILIAFTVAIDIFKQQKWLQLLIENGQNPMIAYVGFANLIWPILNLTGWEAWIIENTATPWLGFLKGVISTLVIALIVSLFTKLKIFWKT